MAKPDSVEKARSLHFSLERREQEIRLARAAVKMDDPKFAELTGDLWAVQGQQADVNAHLGLGVCRCSGPTCVLDEA